MNKKMIISILSVMLVIAGVGYFLWSSSIKEKEDEAAYEKKLADTLEEISVSTGDSALLGSTYQKYWGAIIKDSITFEGLSNGLGLEESDLVEMVDRKNTQQFMYGKSGLKKGEFNTMIAIVSLARSTEAKSILEQHAAITDAISELNNPSEDYKDKYESLLEVYEMYDAFVSISTSPVGSYIEYSKNINSTYETLSSKIKTVKLKL